MKNQHTRRQQTQPCHRSRPWKQPQQSPPQPEQQLMQHKKKRDNWKRIITETGSDKDLIRSYLVSNFRAVPLLLPDTLMTATPLLPRPDAVAKTVDEFRRPAKIFIESRIGKSRFEWNIFAWLQKTRRRRYWIYFTTIGSSIFIFIGFARKKIIIEIQG